MGRSAGIGDPALAGIVLDLLDRLLAVPIEVRLNLVALVEVAAEIEADTKRANP